MICSVGKAQVIESHEAKLLGILIDSDLTFKSHMNSICKKASNKLNALSRQCAILRFHRRKMLMQAFFNSQFSYCPLVWMFHSRSVNTRINNLHYRALRIVYRDETSSFRELLLRDGSVSIHHLNLQSLAIEMFKVVKGVAPEFMDNILGKNADLNYENVSANTRSESTFYNAANPKTVNYGLQTLRSLGPKVWDMIPNDLKNVASVSIFKTKIRKWTPEKCPCRLCLQYVPQLGYI